MAPCVAAIRANLELWAAVADGALPEQLDAMQLRAEAKFTHGAHAHAASTASQLFKGSPCEAQGKGSPL